MQTNYKTENLIKLPKVGGKKKLRQERQFAKDREAHNHDGAKTILVAFESLQKIAPTDSQNDCKVGERKREGREETRCARTRKARDSRLCSTLGQVLRSVIMRDARFVPRLKSIEEFLFRAHGDLTVGSSLASVFIYPHFNYFNLWTFFSDFLLDPMVCPGRVY
jgi:hypothetical protein